MPNIPTQLQKLNEQVDRGEQPGETVRTLLSWFGAHRRGFWKVKAINSALQSLQLKTTPNYEYAYIDELIGFVRATPPTAEVVDVTESSDDKADSTPIEDPVSIGFSSTDDPTYRVGKLVAANNAPTSVAPAAAVAEAITIMLANDYSQLPVMTGTRTVKGMISWQSLGSRLAVGQTVSTVSDCMEKCHEISSEISIFEAISHVVRYDAVVVRDTSNLVAGIVTTHDLSLQFRQLGEPFLLLGEIENHIRTMIDGKFLKDELEAVRDPEDSDREINDVSDMTFGEYLRLVENADRWNKLGLGIDRKVFISKLDRVREIRNDVMHFDPDGIADDDLVTLRLFVQFLQNLQELLSSNSGGDTE